MTSIAKSEDAVVIYHESLLASHAKIAVAEVDRWGTNDVLLMTNYLLLTSAPHLILLPSEASLCDILQYHKSTSYHWTQIGVA